MVLKDVVKRGDRNDGVFDKTLKIVWFSDKL